MSKEKQSKPEQLSKEPEIYLVRNLMPKKLAEIIDGKVKSTIQKGCYDIFDRNEELAFRISDIKNHYGPSVTLEYYNIPGVIHSGGSLSVRKDAIVDRKNGQIDIVEHVVEFSTLFGGVLNRGFEFNWITITPNSRSVHSVRERSGDFPSNELDVYTRTAAEKAAR